MLRSVDPDTARAACECHDARVTASLSRLCGDHRPLEHPPVESPADIADGYGRAERDFAVRQSQLPLKHVGGGFLSAVRTAPAAYIGGAADFLRFMGERSDMFPAVQSLITADRLLSGTATPLVHLRRAWDTMAHTLGGEQHLCRALGPSITGVDTLHTADPKVQKRICECMHKLEFDTMTDANSIGEIGGPPSIEDAIRIKSCSAEGSAWLRCVPHRRELWMANNAFVHAVNFRFGVPQRFLQAVDRCHCHDRYDRHRAHARRHGTRQNHSNRGRRQRAKRRRQRHIWRAVKDKPPPGRVDGRGHHFLQCNTVEKLTKHNRIQSAVKRVGEDAGLTAQRAVPHDLRAGSNDRGMQVPDLKFYDYGPDMVDLLVDITQLYPGKIAGIHLFSMHAGCWLQPVPALHGWTGYSQSFRDNYCAAMTYGANCSLPDTEDRNVLRTGTSSVCGQTPTLAAQQTVGFNMKRHDTTSDAILSIARAIKNATDRKILILLLYGDVLGGDYLDYKGSPNVIDKYAGNLQSFGYLSAKKLIDSPDIDGFANSPGYSIRQREPTTPFSIDHLYSSLAAHGKLSIILDDTRGVLIKRGSKGYGMKFCRTTECTINVMRRNMLTNLVSNRAIYSWGGEGWVGENDTASHRATTAVRWPLRRFAILTE
eukprot:COSAG01_NODE_292_length_19376_cov_61.487239_17_plen_654_part_00